MAFNLNDLLNDRTRKLSQKETNKSEFEIKFIDVAELKASKDNFYETNKIEELANAIELAGGIKQNLIVKPQKDGTYELIAGHRRRLAILKLIEDGKEEYRKVPCVIQTESERIQDKLVLILTNSTQRQLSDWEKIQQAKELKEVLLEYKKVLAEENQDKKEKVKLGRIRDIIANMLEVSPTQVARYESIDKNLNNDFKEELKQGNIGITVASELSKVAEERQKDIYKEYEEKGKQMQIKDICNDERIQDVEKEVAVETKTEAEQKDKEKEIVEVKNDYIVGQKELADYEELEIEVTKKGLSFPEWLYCTYGKSQYSMIQKEIREVILSNLERKNCCPSEWETMLVNAIHFWVDDKTKKYKKYLTEQ